MSCVKPPYSLRDSELDRLIELALQARLRQRLLLRARRKQEQRQPILHWYP